MIGMRYEICRLTTAKDKTALKAVVEPMLMSPSSMSRTVVVRIAMVGIWRFRSILERCVENGRPVILPVS